MGEFTASADIENLVYLFLSKYKILKCSDTTSSLVDCKLIPNGMNFRSKPQGFDKRRLGVRGACLQLN